MNEVKECQTTKPHFVGWNKIGEGYYLRSQLDRDFGLKPFNIDDYDATLRAYQGGRWRDFYLYHIDNCVEIKRRKVKEYEFTVQNIAEALYNINKSAKVSRDTKVLNYDIRKYKVVGTAKTRERRLYDLKNKALDIAVELGIVSVLGYHVQEFNDYTSYLKLIKIGDYTFHMPIYSDDIKGLEKLGEIGTISSEKTKETNLNFYESENLLKRFIESDINLIKKEMENY